MKALPPARTAALALAVNGFAEWRSRWQREAMLARCCVLFPKQHSVTNTGAEDLIFLVIYDPPNTNGTPLS
jgi:oxalate decarboxylase/phosphoglucose isomerase-like protein (cupin superfamily)